MERYAKQIMLLSLLMLAIGFFIGRSTMASKDRIEYVQGKEVHDTIRRPMPYLVEIPSIPALPTIADTLRLPGDTLKIIQKVDTSKIIANYIKKNSYRETLFDNDTLGALSIGAVIQYNEMQSLDYSFTPIYKKITSISRKTITPFVFITTNTFGNTGIGAGAYYNNLGLSAKYLAGNGNNGLEIGVHVKF